MSVLIVTNGTSIITGQVIGGMIEVGGTAGPAAVQFPGGLFSYAVPTIGQTSVITSAVTGQTTAEQTELLAQGAFVNQGTILANGPVGSTFTVEVQTGTSPAGYFFNYGSIEVDVGNAMTIVVGAGSEFFNANSVVANGGSLLLTTTGSAMAGGLGPVRGVYALKNGGTIEDNTGIPSGAGGNSTSFLFADNSHDVLKIDQLAQYNGAIDGFASGDTIDVGTTLVTSVSYNAALHTLTILNGTGTVGSLSFGTGNFSTASFTLGTVSGETILTTTGTNTPWISDGPAPGAGSSAVISGGGTINTGSGAISIASLLMDNPAATLTVSDSLTTSVGPLVNAGGSITVAAGGTIVTDALTEPTASTGVLVSSGGKIILTGRTNTTFVNNGTNTVNTASGPFAARLNGTVVVNGGTVLGGPNGIPGSEGGEIQIGANAGGTPASVTVEAGGVVTDTYSVLGSDSAGFASLTLTGTGTSWTDVGDPKDTLYSRGYMLLGDNNQAVNTPAPPYAGAATLTVSSGATLTEASYVAMGNSVDSAGVANINTGGVWNIGLVSGGYLQVGRLGSGTLNIAGGTVSVGNTGTFLSNGTTFTGGGIGVGSSAGASGTINITAGLLTTTNGIGVGKGGTGLVNLTGGTIATTGTSGIGIGGNSGVSGTLIVNGPGALVTIAASGSGIGVGQAGNGTLEVEGGGKVVIGAGGLGVGNTAGANGTVTVTGAGSEIVLNGTTHSVTVGQGGTGQLTVSSGGLLQINNGQNLNLGGYQAGPLSNTQGTVVVQGGGSIQASGNAVVWSGSTLTVDGASGIDIGTLGLFAPGDIMVESGHSLIGNGFVNAAVLNNGTIDARNPTNNGTLEITSNISGVGFETIETDAILRLDGSVASGQAIQFGSGSELLLGSGATLYTMGLQGLNIGDRIEFGAGQVVTSATFNAGTITAITSTGSILLTNASFTGGSPTTFFTGVDSSTGFHYIQVNANSENWAGSGSGGAGTDLGTGSNWNGGTVPASNQIANFYNSVGAAGTLTGTASVIQASFTGTNGWVLNDATMTLGGLPNPPYTPFAAGFNTNVTIKGGTLNAAGGGTYIGSSSGATVVAQSGAVVTTEGDNVGTSPDQSGTLLVNGASWSEVTGTGGGGYLSVGFNGGSGSVAITGGSLSTAGYATLGYNAGSSGYVTVNSGGAWTAQGINLGAAGLGTLTVNSGTVTTTTGNLDVGSTAAGEGTVVVNSGGLIKLGGTFNAVGGAAGAAGALVINAGGTVEFTVASQSNNVILQIGSQGASGTLAPAIGSALVTGTGALLNTNNNPLSVGGYSGAGAIGVLTIANGGTVESGTSNSNNVNGLIIGKYGSGSVTASGQGSMLSVTGYARVGEGGTGTLTVQNSAVATFALDPTNVGGIRDRSRF